MITTDLAWIMDDLDDVDEIGDSRVRMCNSEEDEKNQKILVGSGSLAETSVLFTITPISSQHPVSFFFCVQSLYWLCSPFLMQMPVEDVIEDVKDRQGSRMQEIEFGVCPRA